MNLRVLPQHLAVVQLPPRSEIPEWVTRSDFFSVTSYSNELSIFCDESVVPSDRESLGGWRAFYVDGVIDLDLAGILTSLAVPLATKQISIFSISTHDTDFLVVRETDLEEAIEVLERAGHSFELGH